MLFHCHLRPVFTALLFCCFKSHTDTLYDAYVDVRCIFHVFLADCPCASDACEWDHSNTSHPCGSHWIKYGGKTIVVYWSCLAPLRKKEIENKHTHAHAQTAICHGCRQPGHHLPLQMGQNTQNNRLREKERDEQGTIAGGSWHKPMVIILSSPEPRSLRCVLLDSFCCPWLTDGTVF